jgi:hypothetical protein
MKQITNNTNSIYDDADFLELVLKHVIKDNNILNLAKQYKMCPEDLGGIEIYQGFLKIALDLEDVPVSMDLFLIKIKEAYSFGTLRREQEKQILDLLCWVYNDQPLDSQYITQHFHDMLKHRRGAAILRNCGENIDKLEACLGRLSFDMDKSQTDNSDDSVIYPFLTPVFKTIRETFSTGFLEIDAVADGLGLGELGMIIGYSGTGKTAVAVHAAMANALNGVKVLYISLEEPSPNIANRLYANYFSINYSDLHHVKNGAAAELQSKMSDLSPGEINTLMNVRIAPLKNKAPVTFSFLRNYLENIYQTEGYHPDIIYIDQLNYVVPTKESDASWENYEKLTFEAALFSNYMIGGKHKFAVWLLHQAGGKMRRQFSNAEITGFKGLIRTPTLVMGIGKDTPQDTTVHLFSLKNRHSKTFGLDYLADLSYMRFAPMDKGGEARMNKEKELLEGKKPRRNGYKNIPEQLNLRSAAGKEILPAPGGAFV